MKVTEEDRRLLAALGPDARAIEDVAETLGRSPDSLQTRLDALAENGLVADAGENRYRRTESGRRLTATAGGRVDEGVDTSPAVEEALAAVGLAPDAADAVRAAFAFLRYWGAVTADELVDAIYTEWPAGFDDPDEWWNTVHQGLAALPEIEESEFFAVDRADDAAPSTIEGWRYAGTAEATTPAADGFLPSERRGHRLYGSVTHAIESLDRTPAERAAVRAAFAVLRRRGTASEAAIGEAVFEGFPAGYESIDRWWEGFLRESFTTLPGVSREPDGDGTRWRYELGRTD